MSKEHELIKKLATKYGVSMAQVEEAIYSQHRFIAHVMKNEADRDTMYFPSIRVIGMGIFHCPDKIKKKLNYMKQGKDGTTN